MNAAAILILEVLVLNAAELKIPGQETRPLVALRVGNLHVRCGRKRKSGDVGAPVWCTGLAVFRESPHPGGLNEVADLRIGAHGDPSAVLLFAASKDPLPPCRFSQGSDHGVVPSSVQGGPQPFGRGGAGVPERQRPMG
jgi:hypothetical protein